MNAYKDFAINIIKSPIAQYIGIQYLSYGLQFINAILIAKYLGVLYFGIYSFLLLINQYLLYSSIAPSYSLNAILASRKNENEFVGKLWNNALLLSCTLVGLVFLSSEIIIFYTPNIFLKYHFSEYSDLVLLIFALTSINNLFVNLYRIYGLLQKINFNQLIIPLIQFITIFFVKEKELLYYLLVGTVAANIISLLLFLHKTPLKNGFSFNKLIFKDISTRGFHLLLYNVSFYLILLSSRTIVSIYYSAEELGYYTLAVNLSNAIFIIVGAFSSILYPKLLFKFSTCNEDQIKQLLLKFQSLYITGCYLLTFLGFLAIPLIELFLPQYTQAMPAFKILLLTQLFLNNNFGNSILLVAKKKERSMTNNALSGMILIIVISLIFTNFKCSFTSIAVAVSFGFSYFCIKITGQAFKLIGKRKYFTDVLLELFPLNFLIPIIILIISIVIKDNYFLPSLSLIVFSMLNMHKIKNVLKEVYLFIKHKESLNF